MLVMAYAARARGRTDQHPTVASAKVVTAAAEALVVANSHRPRCPLAGSPRIHGIANGNFPPGAGKSDTDKSCRFEATVTGRRESDIAMACHLPATATGRQGSNLANGTLSASDRRRTPEARHLRTACRSLATVTGE